MVYSVLVGYLMKIASRPTTIGEHAEAFGERREDDRDAADLAGGVGVAPDRGGGEAAEDADADAGAEDPEGGETGADVLHV